MNTGEAALKPRLLVLAAAALFSTGGAAIKSVSLTAWQVAALRSAVAIVALAVMLPNARRRPGPPMVLVGVFYAATLILFVQATKMTTAADAIFLQDTAPLYVLLAAPFVLGERVVKADLWFMLALAVGLTFFFVGKESPIGTAPNPHDLGWHGQRPPMAGHAFTRRVGHRAGAPDRDDHLRARGALAGAPNQRHQRPRLADPPLSRSVPDWRGVRVPVEGTARRARGRSVAAPAARAGAESDLVVDRPR
jgi:hypothetical protein